MYRKLPQLGDLLDSRETVALAGRYSREQVADAMRAVLDRVRQELREGDLSEASLNARLALVSHETAQALETRLRPSLHKVINATGVLLQTNLGRAPLSAEALERIAETAGGYCNLEMDVATGERSRRDVHAESLILEVLASRLGVSVRRFTETRAAVVVNNCAAATLLGLNTLAEGGEVLVSRGELVEIGGGFRVPEILRKSGALLREVGTTNRTRVGDYAAAITPETRLILRVHQSNFRIEGFSERPSLPELIELGERTSVPVFEDQGTGDVFSLKESGIEDEASWVTSAGSGVALVAASGDKLLGGPQCGVLVGNCAVIERIRANPLYRALRVDKLTYAALQGTLLAYATGREQEIPVIAMLHMPAEAIRSRCERYVHALRSTQVSAETMECRSLIGGGTTPGATLPSFAVALRHAELSESALAARLRTLAPPVIGRISQGRVLLDLRTVFAADDDAVIRSVQLALGDRCSPGADSVDGFSR